MARAVEGVKNESVQAGMQKPEQNAWDNMGQCQVVYMKVTTYFSEPM